ncbi:hypothetical protein Forpi1262_v007138 [Fusarium oxysporum f. sp. raphani]|uniref:Uncharacterized protein n=1 Tax=Fusarium oxysporum f. sp. raphani TaxID=96318 RepID=A0A8J5PSF1_FUSOX|nr:hypothetical protein Forpi1262_v007138 [Fusarium oxysporum f. sp. raphani]
MPPRYPKERLLRELCDEDAMSNGLTTPDDTPRNLAEDSQTITVTDIEMDEAATISSGELDPRFGNCHLNEMRIESDQVDPLKKGTDSSKAEFSSKKSSHLDSTTSPSDTGEQSANEDQSTIEEQSTIVEQSDTEESARPRPKPNKPDKPNGSRKDAFKIIQKKSNPDEFKIFQNTWALAQHIEGNTSKSDVDLLTSDFGRIYFLMKQEAAAIKDTASVKRFKFSKFLWMAVILGQKFTERSNLSYEKRKKNSPRGRIKHPSDCKRVPDDEIYNQLTEECYCRMGPGYDYKRSTPRNVKEEIREFVQIGLLCINLIKEYGWGSMIIPSTLLEKADFKRMGKKKFPSVFDHIKSKYDEEPGWRRELREISPTLFTCMTQGIPEGYTLKILNLPKPRRKEDMPSLSLAEWFRFEPRAKAASEVTRTEAPLSWLTTEDCQVLGRVQPSPGLDSHRRSQLDNSHQIQASSFENENLCFSGTNPNHPMHNTVSIGHNQEPRNTLYQQNFPDGGTIDPNALIHQPFVNSTPKSNDQEPQIHMFQNGAQCYPALSQFGFNTQDSPQVSSFDLDEYINMPPTPANTVPSHS